MYQFNMETQNRIDELIHDTNANLKLRKLAIDVKTLMLFEFKLEKIHEFILERLRENE